MIGIPNYQTGSDVILLFDNYHGGCRSCGLLSHHVRMFMFLWLWLLMFCCCARHNGRESLHKSFHHNLALLVQPHQHQKDNHHDNRVVGSTTAAGSKQQASCHCYKLLRSIDRDGGGSLFIARTSAAPPALQLRQSIIA